jgi:hypothetical protein
MCCFATIDCAPHWPGAASLAPVASWLGAGPPISLWVTAQFGAGAPANGGQWPQIRSTRPRMRGLWRRNRLAVRSDPVSGGLPQLPRGTSLNKPCPCNRLPATVSRATGRGRLRQTAPSRTPSLPASQQVHCHRQDSRDGEGPEEHPKQGHGPWACLADRHQRW